MDFHVSVADDQTTINSIGNETIYVENNSPLVVTGASPDNQETSWGTPYWADAYFELTVQKEGPNTPTYTLASTDYSPTTQWYSFVLTPAGAGWLPGGTIWLNKDSGQIVWNDGTLPTAPNFLNSGPKNVDVVTYDFTVIFNDGHGSHATTPFQVTVDEISPTFSALPTSAQFHEDGSWQATQYSTLLFRRIKRTISNSIRCTSAGRYGMMPRKATLPSPISYLIRELKPSRTGNLLRGVNTSRM